jgi:mRNA-degrading endonuclease toxin of MazEF toxin-antitoxin module
VEIDDPQGRNRKSRPAVIITPTDQITADGEVRVVGISTQLDAGPPEAQVELQYDARGNCRTGLRLRGVAVCSWVVRVPVRSIQSYQGLVPGRTMIEINQRVVALHGS